MNQIVNHNQTIIKNEIIFLNKLNLQFLFSIKIFLKLNIGEEISKKLTFSSIGIFFLFIAR